MIYVFVSGMINVCNEFNQTKRRIKMSRDQDALNETTDFFSWIGRKCYDFWKWGTTGRGVEYQFICKKFQEDLYGKRNDHKLFKDDLYDRSDNSNVRLSNLYKNFNGGAGMELDDALDNVPAEDKSIIRSSTWSWSSGDDMLTFSRNATKNILTELKFWQDLDNDQKKHVLQVAKGWYQKARTNDPNANDYLCAADKLMCGINVGGEVVPERGVIGGFVTKVNEPDLNPKVWDYEPSYKGDFDPIKYIEELEKEIAQEEKGKTGPDSDKKPTIKEVPDKLPDDKKPNDIKPEDKKPEDKKPNDKKTGDKKAEDKKPEDKNSTEKDKKKIKLSPEKEKAVKESLEQWDKFMQEKGNDMLKKYREEKKGKSLAQKGVSAKGLTDHLKDGSEKQMTALHENAHELADTNTVTPVSESKSR